MPVVPRGFVNPNQIDAGVQRARQALAPAVVRIRYGLDNDWSGEPSVFFRVVLSDEAIRKEKLDEIDRRVKLTVLHEVQAEELGLHSYFNFRTLSELEALQEPAWA